LSAGFGFAFHDHDQPSKTTLRADSNNTRDEDSSCEVVVLKTASQDERPSAPIIREGISITLPSIPNWSSIKEKITDIVIPSWAKVVPGYYKKLQTELSAAPGSLADEIWQEAHNPDINPEIVRYAEVRVSSELCDEEKVFLEKRKRYVRKALAQYLGVPETEVHPDDVPTIAMCGSGGGLRALVAGTSSYLSAQEAGLFDCTTYTAGVSGSCWLQSLYYSSIAGQSHSKLIDHLKQRLDTHIAFPPPLLNLLTTTPTSKYLLSGGYEKFKGVKDADFGLVDVYGLMLGARLLVPGNELSIDNMDLKISNQQRFIAEGQLPLPIYTAVRHEISREDLKANADHGESAAEEAGIESFEQKQDSKTETAWQAHRPDFQWFEWTPYEFFCEDFGAGIPTWSIGRNFSNGETVWREDGMCLPELRLPLLMGIMGSAFCATLSHYYKEIRPLVQGLTGLGILDETITENDAELVKIHPFSPAQVPNFAFGMKEQLPETAGGVHKAQNIQLMDAGMSNNLPIYPLLRPGRDVDILVTFDASADVRKDNWLKVVEDYSKQRNIDGWPTGSGWPMPKDSTKAKDDDSPPSASSPAAAWEGLTPVESDNDDEGSETLEQIPQFEGEHPAEASMPRSSPSRSNAAEGTDLSYCTVWVGDKATPNKVHTASSASNAISQNNPENTTTQATSCTFTSSGSSPAPPHTTLTTPDSAEPDQSIPTTNPLHSPTAGLAVIYFPLIPNPSVPSVNPQTSEYLSTWNMVYTPQQVEDVVALARANFRQGEEMVREVVRGVWERKREMRLRKLGKAEQEAEIAFL